MYDKYIAIISIMSQSSILKTAPFPFEVFFQATYPDSVDTGFNGSQKRRRTQGYVQYKCLHCEEHWSNRKKDNCVYHATSKHSELVAEYLPSESGTVDNKTDMTQSSLQRRITESFSSSIMPSKAALRNTFNRAQYTQTIVGLITRRRLPFSAVKWKELEDLVLAANPAVQDLLITSRHEAMRQIAINFELYKSQLAAERKIKDSHLYRPLD
jgi:hypothetical protein